MRKICLLIFGIVNATFGANHPVFKVSHGPCGMVSIRECNTRESREFCPECAGLFQGLFFRNFGGNVALQPSESINNFEDIEVQSEKSLAIEGITASKCIIFCPCLLLLGNCKIDELVASKSVSVDKGCSLILKRISFPNSTNELCCFDIFGRLEGNVLQIHGDRVAVTNKGSIFLKSLELSNFGMESSIDFLQYDRFKANEISQYGRLFRNYGQTTVKKYNCVTATRLESDAGDLNVDLLTGHINGLLTHAQGTAHIAKVEGQLDFVRNRSSFLRIDQIVAGASADPNSEEDVVSCAD